MKRIVDYRIVIPKNAIFSETRAAYFLQKNIKLVCGKKIPIVDDTTAPEALEIVVGKTSREKLDGFAFERHFNRLYEFVIKKASDRVYLCGMGAPIEVEPPFRSYGTMKDGGVGTVYAAYKFVEDVLGYDFMNYVYKCYNENSELCMPEKYELEFTAENRANKDINVVDGASVYSLAASSDLVASNSGLIFKTGSGKLIVYDGGGKAETERLLYALRRISGEEIPTVSAWLLSHPHEGHVGAFVELCKNEALRSSLKVEKAYCAFLTKDAYEKYRLKEAEQDFERVSCILDSESTLGAKVCTVKVGDVISVDEMTVEVLRVPTYDHEVVSTVNDTSVVYKLDYNGEQSFMLAGDGETFTNNELMALPEGKVSSDVIFVPHHGKSSLSPQFYSACGAKAYIWQMPISGHYGDRGDGINSSGSVVKARAPIYETTENYDNIHLVTYNDLALPLPMPIV
ncbi:MAG: MBL fold metallo-hydrolase [Ruminococcaceae bacterium]|nr:MBL fold metallo-hydrolase [Oscillospiraceae bacterium]